MKRKSRKNISKYPYQVISIHFSTQCNLQCPFCYQKEKPKNMEKPPEFFINLVPFLSRLAPQIALGGGEPLLHPDLIQKLGKKAVQEGILLNFTTNGKLFLEMTDDQIQKTLENISMISISYDYFKWGNNPLQYKTVVSRIKRLMQNTPMPKTPEINKKSKSKLKTNRGPFQIGCNLLLDPTMFKNDAIPFLNLIRWLFKKVHIDRIFVLYPKNSDFIDLLPFKPLFMILTDLFPHFYVDDLIKQIFDEGSYQTWKHPCHYGKDLISIDANGGVSGCSFDPQPIQILQRPEEILNLHLNFSSRYSCPYLRIKF